MAPDLDCYEKYTIYHSHTSSLKSHFPYLFPTHTVHFCYVKPFYIITSVMCMNQTNFGAWQNNPAIGIILHSILSLSLEVKILWLWMQLKSEADGLKCLQHLNKWKSTSELQILQNVKMSVISHFHLRCS